MILIGSRWSDSTMRDVVSLFAASTRRRSSGSSVSTRTPLNSATLRRRWTIITPCPENSGLPDIRFDSKNEHLAERDHWSERGRATSVANADALDRPRRSVLSLGVKDSSEQRENSFRNFPPDLLAVSGIPVVVVAVVSSSLISMRGTTWTVAA